MPEQVAYAPAGLYPRVSLYALMLAAAGIPLYIHLPQFAAQRLGISLGTLGALLFAIRLIDVVQDPLLGWLIDRYPAAQARFAALAALGLAIGFPVLFNLERLITNVAEPGAGAGGVLPLTVVLVLLFSAYSLGMILLYGRSASLAARPDGAELLRLAGYREAGMLIGVILAAIAPCVFVALGASGLGYPVFGLWMGLLAVATLILCAPIWRRPATQAAAFDLRALRHSGALKLLILALINGLPVAITSTLFLFFVEDRLQLTGKAGPLLVLFFCAAGLSVPLWTGVARRWGARKTLLFSMPLSIAAFIWAAQLGPGALLPFALICIGSGAALGADMVVLPALFSVVLTRGGLKASAAFGMWSFAGKLGLALAAFLVLPALEISGFSPGADNAPAALSRLTWAYAILPCILKIAALVLVLGLPETEFSS